MSDIVAAIVRRTVAAAAVTALVGTRVSVFGDHRSHAAGGTPYITVQLTGGGDLDHMTGHANHARATVQINCVGATYASAQQVRRAVVDLWRGTVQQTVSITGGNVKIVQATVQNPFDARSGPSDGPDMPLFVNIIDLELWYQTT